MPANDRQVGGQHYAGPVQHWDLVVLLSWDYFQAQVTKYLMRWRKKNGVQDLEKAAHFLQRYIEAVKAGQLSTPAPDALPRAAWLAVLDAVDAQAQPVLESVLESTTSELTLDAWVRNYNTRRGYSDDGKRGDLYMVVRKDAVKSDGWRKFTFEGSKGGPDGEFDYFRCKYCRENFRVPVTDPPTDHVCREETL